MPKINRNFQDTFVAFLESIGLSSFGCFIQTGKGLKTEVFEVHPYKETYPCSCDKDEKTCLKHKPNFTYFPEDIQIHWFKYPLRDATCNIDLSEEKFGEILDACVKYCKNK